MLRVHALILLAALGGLRRKPEKKAHVDLTVDTTKGETEAEARKLVPAGATATIRVIQAGGVLVRECSAKGACRTERE